MNNKPNELLNSKAYKKASGLVKETLKSPEHLSRFIKRAQDKIEKNKTGRISQLLESLMTSFRLLRCYVSGEYRDISFESIAIIVAAITYFVMPLDVVPDFLLMFGILDDAALLAWTFGSVADELTRFTDWEKQKHPDASSSQKNSPEEGE